MKPKRIQRKREFGWRKPDGAVYVGRPTDWGNPVVHVQVDSRYGDGRDVAIAMFRRYAEERAKAEPEWLEPLRGKDLCCWCPLDQPCHADVLLDLANREMP